MTSEVPAFRSREEAVLAVERAFLPAGVDWTLVMPTITWDPDRKVIRRFGALPQTMHFGATEIDFVEGMVRFVDEDHRDGGDFEVHRAALSEEWLETLRPFQG